MNAKSAFWQFWLLAAFLFACGPQRPQRQMPPAEAPEARETIVPAELAGWDLLVEAVLGRETNVPMTFQLRIAGGIWAMSFPANSIFPGMQLRAAPGILTLVDTATSRRARLHGKRFDLLDDPDLRRAVLAGPVKRNPDGTWNMRFFGRMPDADPALLELALVPGDAGRFPAVRDVAAFVMRQLPVELPPAVLEMPISRWEWREKRHARTGTSRFTLLQARPARLLKEDVAHDISGYALHPPVEILPKAVQDPRSTLPLVASEERSGILFVNGSPRGILVPGQLAATGVPEAEIQLVPLLGGICIWEGTIRGPHVWTISR